MVPSSIVFPVVYGTFFALMAMGLTLTYMTTKVPNFAYGSFVTIGLYTAYTMHYLTSVNPYGASVVAFVVSGLASVAMYVGILRPLAKRGMTLVGLMIATFGIDIGFSGIFGIYTDYLQARYGLPDAKQFFALPGDFSVFGLQGVVLVAPIVLAVLTALIYLLFTRTKFGVAMRASVENSSLAKILGINVEKVYVVSWMIAGGFAGLAGSLYTMWLPSGTSTGSNLIVQIFAASILGGLSSIFGAVAGGLVVGASEDAVTIQLGQGFGYTGASVIAAAAVVIGVIILMRKAKRPTGRLRDMRPLDVTKRKVIMSGQGVLGLLSILAGVYMAFEMATGFTTDFFVGGLVGGFGAGVLPFETAIPLMIMVIALMILPQGFVSIHLRRRRN